MYKTLPSPFPPERPFASRSGRRRHVGGGAARALDTTRRNITIAVPAGAEEAAAAGETLRRGRYGFDVAHTSVLTRSQDTLWAILAALGQADAPAHYATWRLNERHYGGLTGLDKSETAAKYGEEQVRNTNMNMHGAHVMCLRCPPYAAGAYARPSRFRVSSWRVHVSIDSRSNGFPRAVRDVAARINIVARKIISPYFPPPPCPRLRRKLF